MNVVTEGVGLIFVLLKIHRKINLQMEKMIELMNSENKAPKRMNKQMMCSPEEKKNDPNPPKKKISLHY